MKSIWFKKVKTEIYWLRETGANQALIILFIIMGITIFWVVDSIHHIISEDPKNQIKIEKEGYLEYIAEGGSSLTIVFTNGERYRISNIMQSYGPFNKNKFVKEAKYGDELHFAIWQGDENKYIYQLECNDEIYFSYKQAMITYKVSNIFFFIGSMIMFLVCVRFLIIALIEYVKLRHNREIPENRCSD